MKLDWLDGENCSFWKNSVSLELGQMDIYKVFKDLDKHSPIPEGHKNIQYHVIFGAKHNSKRWARLVADEHLMDILTDSVYSRVISLHGL